MLTPIHRALGLEPGDLSIQLFQNAVTSGVVESADLDWKRELYDSRDPKWQDEVAKDVAAMANSGGGWIIFGIEEDRQTSAAVKVTPVTWDSAVEQRILQATYARVGPPVLGIEFHLVDAEQGCVVAMRVPGSQDAPHFARKGEDAFVAPIRNGPHTHFMAAREIEQAFRNRFAARAGRDRRLQELFEQANTYLNPEEGVCLVLAAMPLEPSTTLQPVSQDSAQRHCNEYSLGELFHDGQPRAPFYHGGGTRRGLRGWLVRGGKVDRKMIRKSLHDDGSLLASYRSAYGGSPEDSASRYYPVGLPNHCMSQELEETVADFVTSLRTHASERSVNGGYLVRAALAGRMDEPIFVRTTEGHTNFLMDVDYSEPIERFQTITTEFDPLAATKDLVGPVSDLARDIINQGGIQYLRVLATA